MKHLNVGQKDDAFRTIGGPHLYSFAHRMHNKLR